MPLLRVGEPEGEFGVGEGDGGLFVIELEIEAGSGGFDVGEPWGGAAFSARWRGFDVSSVKEDALEIPFAVGEMDEVDAVGSLKLMVENSTRRRQRELMRRVARTEAARMTGSEPKAGSSSTTKFSRVKPGSGRRLRLTLPR